MQEEEDISGEDIGKREDKWEERRQLNGKSILEQMEESWRRDGEEMKKRGFGKTCESSHNGQLNYNEDWQPTIIYNDYCMGILPYDNGIIYFILAFTLMILFGMTFHLVTSIDLDLHLPALLQVYVNNN